MGAIKRFRLTTSAHWLKSLIKLQFRNRRLLSHIASFLCSFWYFPEKVKKYHIYQFYYLLLNYWSEYTPSSLVSKMIKLFEDMQFGTWIPSNPLNCGLLCYGSSGTWQSLGIAQSLTLVACYPYLCGTINQTFDFELISKFQVDSF